MEEIPTVVIERQPINETIVMNCILKCFALSLSLNHHTFNHYINVVIVVWGYYSKWNLWCNFSQFIHLARPIEMIPPIFIPILFLHLKYLKYKECNEIAPYWCKVDTRVDVERIFFFTLLSDIENDRSVSIWKFVKTNIFET